MTEKEYVFFINHTVILKRILEFINYIFKKK